jgi:hypothetical protein
MTVAVSNWVNVVVFRSGIASLRAVPVWIPIATARMKIRP